MLAKSAKNKGRRFENYINDQIEEMGFGKAVRTPGSGSGKIKGDSFNSLPFLLECKNHKNVKWWEFIDQSKEQAKIGNKDPYKWALVVRDPRTPEASPDVYAVIDFWELLKLIRGDQESLAADNREKVYWVNRAKEDLKKLLSII